ncbi:hypothetical protein GI374_12185 [Paracoccus sp. S-4012]|uniref:hypothetical protein n=1 Tax=Paracoccus sp. S-4012 TaxID=2665648 RepID=UPI0012AFF5F0|nr:hypothetical protein [Paracoccus sp. S-4012]MRX51194.1 hypothetical protein [Paracoccus sp. S-4012]
MQKIDRATLESMLMDPEVPDSAIRPFLRLDPLDSQSFRPSVIANPALVAFDETESAMALASLNGVARWRRQRRYAAKIRGWTGLKVVAEGDSWFQYPFLIDDVIDHLFDAWAIYCVGAAGDLLQDMVRQDEVTAAVLSEKPDLLLLSGGGNDLLGGGQLARYLKPPRPGMAPEDHISDEFDQLLARILAIYADLVERALTAGAKRVVCHGYDYAIPNGGPWLGRPMLKLGISDRRLQRDIIRVLIDRLHDGLESMAGNFGGRVAAADCRGRTPDDAWYDELHPTSSGFVPAARMIRETAEGGSLEAIAMEMPAPPESRPLPVADEEAVLGVMAMDEETLLAEMGRRQALLELTPDIAESMTLAMPPEGTESVQGAFLDLGRRVAERLNRELYHLLCGDDDTAKVEREKLRQTLKLSDAALIGGIATTLMAIGTPPFLAPLAATVIVRSGIKPAWEETCRFWGERFGPLDPAPLPATPPGGTAQPGA